MNWPGVSNCMGGEMTDEKPKKRMTDEQLASGLRGLQEMNKEAIPKEKRDHLINSIKSLKVIQQLRARRKAKD